MKNIERIARILAKLQKVWILEPERQLCEVLYAAKICPSQDLLKVTDDEAEHALDDRLRDSYRKRRRDMLAHGEFPHCEGCGKPTGEYRRGLGYESTYWCIECLPSDAEFYPGHEPEQEERTNR